MYNIILELTNVQKSLKICPLIKLLYSYFLPQGLHVNKLESPGLKDVQCIRASGS